MVGAVHGFDADLLRISPPPLILDFGGGKEVKNVSYIVGLNFPETARQRTRLRAPPQLPLEDRVCFGLPKSWGRERRIVKKSRTDAFTA